MTVVCIYRVPSDRSVEFEQLVIGHWVALRSEGLVTDKVSQLFKGEEASGVTAFIEIFEWQSEDAVRVAHNSPRISELWSAMDELCRSQTTKQPSMQFIDVESLPILGGEP